MRKSCWRGALALVGLIVVATFASLVVPTQSSALFMRPDPDDTYVDQLSHLSYVHPVNGAEYEPSAFAIAPSGDLWVAQNEFREDEVQNSGFAVYHPGDTAPYEFRPLPDMWIMGMDFDPAGNIVVLDNAGNDDTRVVRYTVSLNTVTEIAAGFVYPTDVQVDGAGNIFVCDKWDNNIEKIAAGSSTVTTFSAPPTAYGQLSSIGLDQAGNIIATDEANPRLIKFSPEGTYLSESSIADLGYGQISDVVVDGYGTTYVTGMVGVDSVSTFTRITANGTRMGTYPVFANLDVDALRYTTKLIVDTWGAVWMNSSNGFAREVRTYQFDEGVVDVWPPVTTSNAPLSWVKGPVNVTLTSVDAGNSDVAAIYHSIDGSYPDSLTTGPVVISAEGTTTLQYYARDRANNAESVITTSVFVDNFAPITGSDIQPRYYGDVEINLTALDALSGVQDTFWSLDNGLNWYRGTRITIPSTSRGDFQLMWYSTDNAGNQEPIHDVVFSAYTHYEQDVEQIVYTGSWSVVSDPGYSGGTYKRSESASAAAYVTFNGNIIEIFGRRGPDMGKVLVRLDNGTAQELDLYSPTAQRDLLGRFIGTGNGDHTLSFVAIGTKNAASSDFDVCIDAIDIGGTTVADETSPVTTDDTRGGWYNAQTLVTLFPTDNAFVAYTGYAIGGGVARQYTGPFAVTGNGSVEIQYRSTDGVGNQEATKTATVMADTVAPSSAATVAVSYVDSATITVVASDNLSGVAKRQYRIDGGSWTDGSSAYITGYGDHSIGYRAIDVAGNVEATQTASFRIRRAVETYTIDSPELDWYGSWATHWEYPNAWRSRFSTSDYVTGYGRYTDIEVWAYKGPALGKARINLDGQNVDVDQYASVLTTAPVKIWDSGTLPDEDHFVLVAYTSRKNPAASGTRVNVHSIVVEGVLGGSVPDNGPPTTTSNIPATWTASPFDVELSQYDYLGNEGPTFYDVSRVPTNAPDATTEYDWPFTVNAEGINYVSYYSEDVFGNREAITTQQLKLDSSPPTTTSNVVDTYTNTALISLTATDTYSGVASTHYSLDGATFTVGATVTVPPSNPGLHTLRWYSKDAVGNTETLKTATFTNLVRYEDEYEAHIEQEGYNWGRLYDSKYSGALMRYAYNPGALAGTFSGDRFDLISATAPDFGIARIVIDGDEVYFCDQYSAVPGYQQRVFSRAGLGDHLHTFRVEWTGTKNPLSTGTNINADAFELVGNMIGDNEPPVSVASPQGAWRTTPETVTITATDNGVVTPVIRYSINGQPEFVYTDAFRVSEEGTTAITYRAIDGVGNEEVARTAYVRIDRTAPSVTPSAPTGWVRGPLYATLTTVDLGSGINSVVYSTDGSDPVTPYPSGTGIYVSAEGTTTIKYKATDNLGNATAVGSFNVRLDRTLPQTLSNAPATWVKGTQLVTLTATDTPSGVASMHFSVDGQSYGLYSGPIAVSGEGTHTLNFHSHDFADNQDSTRTATILIDNSAPVTGNDAPVGWQKQVVTLRLLATDGPSGVGTTSYTLNGGPLTTYTLAGIIVAADGVNAITYSTRDLAGNVEASQTATVRVDLSAPVTGDNADTSWHTTPFSLVLSPSDPYSGVASTLYRASGSELATYTAPITISEDGTNTVLYHSVDALGNTEATKTATVRYDGTAPVTTSDAASVYLTEATIRLAASDAHSGLAHTAYRLDGSEWTTGTVAFTGVAGAHTLEFRSADIAGNVEETRTADFTVIPRTSSTRIEQTSGQLVWSGTWTDTFNVSHSGSSAKWLNSSGSVKLQFRGTAINWIGIKAASYGRARVTVDASAPVTVDTYAPSTAYARKLWGVAGLADKSHTVLIEWTGTKNAASNSTYVGVDAFDVLGSLAGVDTTGPVTTIAPDSTWRTSDSTVTLSATDPSGVESTHYRTDGGPWNLYQGPWQLADEGTHTVDFYSADEVRNTEATKTATLRLDKTAPQTTSDADDAWHKDSFDLSLSAQDAVSGVKSTHYSVNGSELATYTGPVTISGDGTNTVEYRTTDVAGNVEETKTATVRVDGTSPVTTTSADDAWYASPVIVSLEGTDADSGVASTFYSVAGGPETLYTAPFIVSAQGASTVSYWSTDAVGNVEASQTATVRVDLSAPVTTQRIPSVVAGGSSLPLTADDDLSGVAATYRKLDSSAWTTQSVSAPMSTGLHTLVYYTVDRAGNQEPTGSVEFSVDASAPVTTADVPAGWVATDTLVTLTASDAETTVAGTRYQISNSPVLTYTEPFSITGTAAVDVRFGSTDAFGNTEATKTVTVRIDKTAPVTVSDASAQYLASARVLLASSDSQSGVDRVNYRLDGSSWTSGTAVATSVVGTHTLEFAAVDRVGNVEATKSTTFTVLPNASSTRYEQNDPGMLFEGTWTKATNPSHSGNNAKWAELAGATINIQFTGTAINWIGVKAASYGKADVILDGGAPITVDLYDPATQYQQVLWGVAGLKSGRHTLQIIATGTRNALSGGTYVGIDAVDVVGLLEPASVTPARRFEHTDSRLVYQGGPWTDSTNPGHSGTTAKWGNTKGSAIDVAFKGTQFTWVGVKAASYGQAKVTIDDGAPIVVSLYGGTTSYQQELWKSSVLPYGTHSVRIEWTGTKEPASSGTYVGVDAFDIQGSLVQAVPTSTKLLRIEDSDSRLYWGGTWAVSSNGGHSATSARWANTSGSSMNVAFSGTSVDLFGLKASSYGIMKLTLDLNAPVYIDLYSPATAYQQKLWSSGSLADGIHKVRIEFTGTKNPASGGTYVGVDAFDVMGTPVQAVSTGPTLLRYEQADGRMLKTGTWNTSWNVGHSASSAMWSSVASDTVKIAFSGTSATLYGVKASTYGTASVSIDGGEPVQVSCYNSTTTYQQSLFAATGLAEGPHTMTISVAGTKPVGFDCVDIFGELVQAE